MFALNFIKRLFKKHCKNWTINHIILNLSVDNYFENATQLLYHTFYFYILKHNSFFYLSSGTKIYPFELFTLQFDTRFIVLESIDTLQRAHWYTALFSQTWKIWSIYLKNISFAIRRKVRLLFVPWTLKVFLHIMNMILLLMNLKLHLKLFFNFPNCLFSQRCVWRTFSRL